MIFVAVFYCLLHLFFPTLTLLYLYLMCRGKVIHYVLIASTIHHSSVIQTTLSTTPMGQQITTAAVTIHQAIRPNKTRSLIAWGVTAASIHRANR